MGQAASDGGAQDELDITLDAVDEDLVKDLSQIVETQEATKEKLLSQIASCQKQLDRLQAVSDAGTLLLEYLGVHIRTSDRRVRHLGEALVQGEASLSLKDLLGVDPNGDQATFTREEKARFRHINGGSEGLAVRSVAAASTTCKAARSAFGPGLSAWGVARLYGSTLMFEKALGNPSIHKGPHLFFARASLASKDPALRRAAQCLVPRLAKAATAVFGEACTCCRANAAAFLWALFKATLRTDTDTEVASRAHAAAGEATASLGALLSDESDDAPWSRLWADFGEALLPTDPGRTCTFRLASEYGRPGGVWCAEALAGLSGAVVRAAVTGGMEGPSGKSLESLLLFLSKALLLDDEDPGESSDEEDEPLTRTRGFGPVKARSARAGAAVALRVLFEGDFKGVAEARRAGAPRALALSIGLASKDIKHAAAQAAITAAGRALQAFASLNVDAAGRAAAERARASLTNVDAATAKCFASVTERAIADDGIVPKPARILANLVTLASPKNVDALGRRFVDTLGDAAEALHDQNKRVNHFARAVAHSGLFPALQLLTTHDSVSWGVFVDALAQMLSFVQFTLPEVDRNDLNSTSYLLDVTAFLESSTDERRCSTLIAGVAALAEVYPPPQEGPLELWHAWSLLCNASLVKASSPQASRFTVYSSIDVLLRLSWRACVGPPLLQVPRIDPRKSSTIIQLLKSRDAFEVPKDWLDWPAVCTEIDNETTKPYAVEVRDVVSIICYAQLRSWPEERPTDADHDPLPCTYDGARGWLRNLAEPKAVDALYALLREQRPASAECAYRILEALATNDEDNEPLSHAVGRVVYARELRKLGKVAACDVTFDGMLRAALESGLPVCVLEKVRGAWDEARDVRERVASRRGTAEVVVDAKRAEDALKAEAELLSLLDDEEAKASRASKKKQKRKKKKVVKAPAVVAAPAAAADDEPDSDSDGDQYLLRLARHAPEPAPAEAPAPAPARRRRKGKKAAPVVVELPPAPARPVPAVVKAPAAVVKAPAPVKAAAKPRRAPAAPALSLGGLAAPAPPVDEAPVRVAAIGPPPNASKGRSEAGDIAKAAAAAPFGFDAAPARGESPFAYSMMGGSDAAAAAPATGGGSSLFSMMPTAQPAPSRQPSRQPRADECPVCFGTTRECALVPCGHLLCDTCAVVYDDGGRPCPVCRTPVERVMKVYF